MVPIEGYTDNVVSAQSNMKLSRDRANAVKSILVEEVGLGIKMVETKALRQSNPVADNNTAQRGEKNRRVELIVL